MDARGARGGRFMLARARDHRKSARRWTGYDRDRVDARYCIADDRGARGRWADVRESRGFLRPGVALKRKLSQIGSSDRATGCGIIAPRRTSIAHLDPPGAPNSASI